MHVPSGAQYVVSSGGQRAVVTEVGATLRSYDYDGDEVCWGFAEDEMSAGARGQVLAPWPNRLRDGRYEFAGVAGHAALDEPERANAIHGLVRWVPWRLAARDESSVRLEYRLFSQPAYPFQLLLGVGYRLGPVGLAVTVEATAEGGTPTPFGAGFHTYLATGAGRVDGARLALPARSRLLLDERALPVGSEEVAGTPFARIAGAGIAGAGPAGVGPGGVGPAGVGPGGVGPAGVGTVDGREPIGAMHADDCFADLVVGDDGRWRAELLPAGAQAPVVLWAEAVFRYIMCFTGDTLPEADRRLAVAVEPMTCPPDALRTGGDLIVLEPGETFRASWGIVPAGLA